MISFRRIPQIVALLIGAMAILFSLMNDAHSEIDLRLEDVDAALERVAPGIQAHHLDDLIDQSDSLNDEWREFSEGVLYIDEQRLLIAHSAKTPDDVVRALEQAGYRWNDLRWVKDPTTERLVR